MSKNKGRSTLTTHCTYVLYI